jgi:uncharacterized membrane protein YesL
MYRYLQDHPRLARWLDSLGGVVLINLIGLLAALPLVTAPPAIAGVFAFTARIARGEHPDLMRDFVGSFRRSFLRSWLTIVIGAIIWSLVLVNLSLIESSEIPLGGVVGTISILLGVGWILTNLYLWPLIVLLDRPYLEIVKLATRLALGHLPWSVGLLALTTLFLLGALNSPILFVLVAFGGTCLLVNIGSWRVIRRYLAQPTGPDLVDPA